MRSWNRVCGRTGRGAMALAAGSAMALAVALGAGPAAAEHVGAFDIGGAIDKAYIRGGGQAFFGNPTTPESNAAQGGKFQVFERGCSIYWSIGTDAHDVCGLIRDKYAALGWEKSPLGFPVSDEAHAGNDGAGRYNLFPGGVIYWSQETGAHAVWGNIAGIWQGNGAEKGHYGYPTSDEYDNGDGGGKAQDFQGGTITWNP